MNNLDWLSNVLEEFCIRHNLEFECASDLLHFNVDKDGHELTSYQRNWLTCFCETWDLINHSSYTNRL